MPALGLLESEGERTSRPSAANAPSALKTPPLHVTKQQAFKTGNRAGDSVTAVEKKGEHWRETGSLTVRKSGHGGGVWWGVTTPLTGWMLNKVFMVQKLQKCFCFYSLIAQTGDNKSTGFTQYQWFNQVVRHLASNASILSSYKAELFIECIHGDIILLHSHIFVWSQLWIPFFSSLSCLFRPL